MIVVALIGAVVTLVTTDRNYDTRHYHGVQETTDQLQPSIDELATQVAIEQSENALLQNKFNVQSTRVSALLAQVTAVRKSCILFIEHDKEVVLDPQNYSAVMSGSLHPTVPDNLARNARSVSWEPINTYPGAVQALPDEQLVNTFDATNGPALLYVIKFTNPGVYYVYVRGLGINNNGDSVYVGLGGIAASAITFLSQPDWGKPAWLGQPDIRTEQPISVHVPVPGIYTFYLWMRENGVIVDKIWLHSSDSLVASGDTYSNPEPSKCEPNL